MPSAEKKVSKPEKVIPKEHQKEVSGAFWDKLKPVIGEYFDYIIADIIKGVISELPPAFNMGIMLDEIKNDFLEFWHQYFIPSDESYITREKTLGLDIRHAMIDSVKKYKILGEVMEDFIVNTLVQMSVDLKSLIIESLPNVQIDEGYMLYLQRLVNEYVMVTYLDHFVIAQAIKILFYIENIGFGEVYELRQKIVEFFRDFIYNTQKIAEFRKFLSENIDHLNISQNNRRLFEKILFGFFSTVIQHKQDPKMLEYYKQQIRQRMVLVKSNLIFPTREKKKFILDWIEKQIQMVFHFSSPEFLNKHIPLQTKVTNLFIQAVNEQMDIETFDDKLDDMHIDSILYAKDIPNNPVKQKTTKKHVKEESSSNASKYNALFNRIVYSDDDVLSLDASELPSTIGEIIRALGHMVLVQIENDLSLQKLADLIQELSQEGLPGGNEYFI